MRPFRLKPKYLCNISIEVSLTAVKSPINVYILAQGPDNSRDLCSAAQKQRECCTSVHIGLDKSIESLLGKSAFL